MADNNTMRNTQEISQLVEHVLTETEKGVGVTHKREADKIFSVDGEPLGIHPWRGTVISLNDFSDHITDDSCQVWYDQEGDQFYKIDPLVQGFSVNMGTYSFENNGNKGQETTSTDYSCEHVGMGVNVRTSSYR